MASFKQLMNRHIQVSWQSNEQAAT